MKDVRLRIKLDFVLLILWMFTGAVQFQNGNYRWRRSLYWFVFTIFLLIRNLIILKKENLKSETVIESLGITEAELMQKMKDEEEKKLQAERAKELAEREKELAQMEKAQRIDDMKRDLNRYKKIYRYKYSRYMKDTQNKQK